LNPVAPGSFPLVSFSFLHFSSSFISQESRNEFQKRPITKASLQKETSHMGPYTAFICHYHTSFVFIFISVYLSFPPIESSSTRIIPIGIMPTITTVIVPIIPSCNLIIISLLLLKIVMMRWERLRVYCSLPIQ